MNMRARKPLAMLLAVLSAVSLGLGQTASAEEPVLPPSSRISPTEVERNFTVPNSIHIDVADENGGTLTEGSFQLIDSAGNVLINFNNRESNAFFSADDRAEFDAQSCSIYGKDLYDTGDFVSDKVGIFTGKHSRYNLDAYFPIPYGTSVDYVSYGDLFENKPSITIPANQLCINVDSGYREDPNLPYPQLLALNGQEYRLSDIAGSQTMLSAPAGTYSCHLTKYSSQSSSSRGEINTVTASAQSEKYVAVTLNLHELVPQYVNENGQYIDESGKLFRYGAAYSPQEKLVTTAYLQITSGAMTNFVSLDGSPNATVYLKEGDYLPRFSYGFSFKDWVSNASGSLGGQRNVEHSIYRYAKHTITVDAPPATGITVGFIPAGTYTLHQVSAAAGRDPAPDQTITVTDSSQRGSMQMLTVVNPKTPDHVHTYSPDWSFNESRHWHAATCQHSHLVNDLAGHTYGDWVVTVDPTETAVGTKERTCSVCGYKQTAELPVLPHTHKTQPVAGQAPTCVTAGWKDFYSCSGCNRLFADKDAQREIIDLTVWKAEGGRGYLAPTGHSFGTEWNYDTFNHWHVCSCGEKADAAAHDWTWIVDKEATDSAAGSKHEECSVCGSKKAAVVIPATGTPATPDTPATGTPAAPDKPAANPKTGDTAPIGLWSVLGAASLLGAACIFWLNRKKKAN